MQREAAGLARTWTKVNLRGSGKGSCVKRRRTSSWRSGSFVVRWGQTPDLTIRLHLVVTRELLWQRKVIEQLLELLQLHSGGLVMAWQRCQLLYKEVAVVLWSMGRRWQVFRLRLVWINEVVFMVLELKVVLGSR
jgi:hypothetical protein